MANSSTRLFPATPEVGVMLPPTRDSAEIRDFLALRRSAGKHMLSEPGPDDATLSELLRIAARVPDHRRVEPWRFVVIRGEARHAFGSVLAERYRAINPGHTDEDAENERKSALRAPVIVIVVSSPDPTHKTPVWEQELSAGALCHQLCLACSASGFGAVWLTEWMAFDPEIAKSLGLKEGERIAGQILIGTTDAAAPERPRPDMRAKVTEWTG